MGRGMTMQGDDDLHNSALTLLATLRRARRAEPRISDRLTAVRAITVPVEDGSIAAWRLGTGSAVLLVHGWDDDHLIWEPLLDHLRASGRAVVVMDLPGHGLSTAEEASYPYAARAVLAVAAALGPIHAIVGHSFGCAAAVFSIAQGLNVERAVLIAPPVPRSGPGWADVQRSRGTPDALIEKAKAIFEARTGVPLAPYDIEQDAATLKIPALFVYSDDDPVCLADLAAKLAARWPGANQLVLRGQGHRRVARATDTIYAIDNFISGGSI